LDSEWRMTDAGEGLDVQEPEWTWARRPIISLSYPQFRLFWLSNLIVAVGLMIEFTARGWLTVQLTDSALLLGAVEGTWGVTFALGSIPMGIAADRINRRNLLVAGTVVALSVALVIGMLVAADLIAIWHVLTAAAISGVLFALRFPVGQAMTAKLVPGQHLMNAISLNTAGHSLPNVAGPAAGGVLIALLGIAGAYFVTSGAYLMGLLMMLGVAAAFGRIERAPTKSAKDDLREAYEYLRAHRDLLQLTGVMLIPFILGQSYVLLLPLFVEKELDRGPETFGALSACLGAGSLIGAMAVATFGKQRLIGLLMFAGVLGTGSSAIAYGLSQWVPLTGAVLFVAGSAESALFAAYETLLLVRLPDEIRGRVMGLMFTLVALFPVGAIAAGAIADVIGLRALAVAEGVIIVAMSSVAWRVVLRRVVTKAE
jgi:MFS family permease